MLNNSEVVRVVGISCTTKSTKVFSFTREQFANAHKSHPAWMFSPESPRYDKTYCSQCGQEFGPGDCGYSHCENHIMPNADLDGT